MNATQEDIEKKVKRLRELMSRTWMFGCQGGVTFREVWQGVDAIMGRSTYNSELAFPELLEEELRTGQCTLGKSFEKMQKAMNDGKGGEIIVVVPPKHEGSDE